MADKTSLNEKLSDIVGSSNYKINDNLNLKYNFSIDQNYKDINYSEIATSYNFNSINFDFGYLNEKKHIGDKNYFTTEINYKNTNIRYPYPTFITWSNYKKFFWQSRKCFPS